MPEKNRFSASALWTFVQDRLTLIIVLIYSLMVLVSFLFYPILYLSSLRTPFLGVLVEHTVMLNTSAPTQPGAWNLRNQLPENYPFGYQIKQIDHKTINDVKELRSVLAEYEVGDTVNVVLSTPDKQQQEFRVELQHFPLADQISYFWVPYILGLVYLVSGLYVFGVRRYEPSGRAFALFATSMAICMGGLYEGYFTYGMVQLWTAALAFAGGALFNLAAVFPEQSRLVTRYPFLRWVGYLFALPLALNAVLTIYDMSRPDAYVWAWRLEFIFVALSVFVFLGMVGFQWTRSTSPIVREQARLIFLGALGFLPIVLWFLATSINPSWGFSAPLMMPWLAIFPIATGYAIIRYRLLSTDYLLSRAVLYALLTALAVIGYALLVTGLTQIFGGTFQTTNPFAVGFMVFALALGLNPVRTLLQNQIDAVFFHGQTVYRERQQAFGRELTQAMELPEVVTLLRQYIDTALLPDQMHVFVFDVSSAHYVAATSADGKPSSDVRFSVSSTLVQGLSSQRNALFLSNLGDLPATLQSEQARLALLGAQLFVPLPGRKQLVGWLALGPRRSGEPYNSQDLIFLEVLSDQAALAVERAQVVTDLEQRVRETTVLTRVAQGISFTMTFDDILELLATQTNQVMPARDFRVTLYEKETEVLSHAFYLENDERLSEREKRPLAAARGLEWEVLRNQRPLLTEDYERECRGRGLIPADQGIYAWMGVPLNAGAETIGLISVASRDPAVIYTNEQRSMLQAVADQASGAIVKARLLEESERRARQLAMLNEIGIGLTSTLDLKLLLSRILDSATGILNCEAGSLFLVDQQTDELIFEVVIGPVASNLLGRRLPPGTGLVGQAAQTGRAMIVNDAKRRKEWFEKTDIQTGFDTQDLLAVPMRVQERTIGVIEVINKRNGAPFSQADQDLLMAFTSQATIAIDNARLYTLTDQALADRVEELSVMQRIDRELNASLDIERAMRITLEWAMRQSLATAGLVGTVEKEGVRVMVAEGYPESLSIAKPQDNGTPNFLPLDSQALREAVTSGQPKRLVAAQFPGDSNFGLLPGSLMQVVIPIRRETETIGILLLESNKSESCSDELLTFLSRLSDHASISIANARLFEEVKEANLAKSRFVSFVAHELKNPMASIKGYTELVAQGMAGPVTDMQSSFLGTVRANVDRMNTIVSDLNDLTKIQVGNMRLEYRTVQVRDILEEVVRSLQRQVDDKQQKYTMSVPDDIPMAWADPARMGQILMNLVSNAIKYTPEGREFGVGAERYVSPDPELAGAQLIHIWVSDRGIGISEEDQKKIFQQYFRTDSAKEMASGTGLGLNITKSLIEMQGGRIWFDSKVGEGTTFHFTVPIAETQ